MTRPVTSASTHGARQGIAAPLRAAGLDVQAPGLPSRSVRRAARPATRTARRGRRGGAAPLLAGRVAALAAYPQVYRPWQLRWGATDAAVQRPMLGDALVPHP